MELNYFGYLDIWEYEKGLSPKEAFEELFLIIPTTNNKAVVGKSFLLQTKLSKVPDNMYKYLEVSKAFLLMTNVLDRSDL